MIAALRKYFFLLFRKLVPVSLIDAAIKEERINLYKQYCVLGENSSLHADARIINLGNDPEKIMIGKQVLVRGELFTSKYGGKITIGDFTFIGEHSRIWSGEEIIIGNHVQISHGVNITDTNTHSIDHIDRQHEYNEVLRFGYIPEKGNISTAAVIIEDHAWISFNATVLKGVRVGKGAVVAAHSVVTKDVEPFTMVAGNPAVKIKSLA